MKLATAVVCFLSLSGILAGCSKQREIPGEIFSYDIKNGIIKQAGTVVCFLTPQEHERFETLLKNSRDRRYQRDRALWESSYKEYNKIFNKYKREDGKVYQSDTGEERMNKLKELEAVISEARTNIEQKIYDREISFDEEGREQVKQFLASIHQTIADSEGKFKVILSVGTEYWILAEAQISPTRWYFRYVPDGNTLILSDGNAL